HESATNSSWTSTPPIEKALEYDLEGLYTTSHVRISPPRAAPANEGARMTFPILSTEQLRQCAARLPRLDLAHLPTPLEEVPRFADRIRGGGVLPLHGHI